MHTQVYPTKAQLVILLIDDPGMSMKLSALENIDVTESVLASNDARRTLT